MKLIPSLFRTGKKRLTAPMLVAAIPWLLLLSTGIEAAHAASYLEQTNSTIDKLNRSIELINSGASDEAQQALRDATQSVNELRQASARTLKLANQQHDICLDRVVTLSNQVSGIYQQEIDLRKKIDELNATIAKATQDQQITKNELDGLQASLRNAAAGLRAREEKLQELSRWFWVPGYGQYLAIRTLVDDDIGQYNSLLNTLRDTETRLRHNSEILNQVETLKTSLLMEKENMAQTSSKLSRMRAELDKKLSGMKAVVVFLTSGDVFWQKMGGLLNVTIKGHEGDIKLLYDSLSKSVELLPFFKNEIGATTQTFKESLLEFGKALDANKSFQFSETDSYCPVNW